MRQIVDSRLGLRWVYHPLERQTWGSVEEGVPERVQRLHFDSSVCPWEGITFWSGKIAQLRSNAHNTAQEARDIPFLSEKRYRPKTVSYLQDWRGPIVLLRALLAHGHVCTLRHVLVPLLNSPWPICLRIQRTDLKELLDVGARSAAARTGRTGWSCPVPAAATVGSASCSPRPGIGLGASCRRSRADRRLSCSGSCRPLPPQCRICCSRT